MTKMEESEVTGEDIDSSSLGNHNIIKTEAGDMHPMSIDFTKPEVTTSNTDSNTSVPLKCAACKKVIVDKYYLHLDNKCWHENCVQCSACGVALYESCFLKNRKLFCKQDYDKLRGQCKGCQQTLTDTDRVLVLENSTYHVACFACEFCRRLLQRGDQYLLLTEDKEAVCCKHCYDSESRVTFYADDSGSDQSLRDDDVFSPGAPSRSLGTTGLPTHYLPHHTSPLPGYNPMHHRNLSASEKGMSGHQGMDSKRSKRPRTILTTAQRRKFKASFEISQKPCRKVRETLAAETGLSPRVVQVWFQNQRAKMKKIARRQTQGEGGERGRGKNRKRKDGDSDSENECSSPGSYSSTPTPRLYNEMYTSPGSMQTSPTPKHDVTNDFLSPMQQPAGSMDVMYDEFGSGMSTSPYLSTPNGSMTSGTSTVTLQNLEHVSPSMTNSHRPLNIGYDGNRPDCLRGNVAMRVDDSVGTSCDLNHSLTQFMTNRTQSNSLRTNNDIPTPMEDLIHMQSNFFRT